MQTTIEYLSQEVKNFIKLEKVLSELSDVAFLQLMILLNKEAYNRINKIQKTIKVEK